MRKLSFSLLLLLLLFCAGAFATDQDLEHARGLRAAGHRELAAQAYRDVVRSLDEAAEEAADPDDSWAADRLLFDGAVARFEWSTVLDPESASRSELLEAAAVRLEDVLWRNEDNILGAWCFLYWGLAALELGDEPRGMELLETAASYPLPEGPPDREVWVAVVLAAHRQVGETGAQTLDEALRERARNLLLGLEERVPEAVGHRDGLLALIELGRSLAAVGDRERASEVLLRVVEAADGAVAARAEELLVTVAGEDLLARERPEVLLRVADRRLARREWRPALAVLHRMLGAARSGAERPAPLPEAWRRVGYCYLAQEKCREAERAFHRMAAESGDPGGALSADAAYWRFRAAAALHSATGDELDGRWKAELRREFTTRFPDHERAEDLYYHEASDQIATAVRAGAEGRDEEAAGLLRLALEQLAGVGPGSDFHELARARSGEALFRLERDEEAIERFDEVRRLARDLESRDSRRQRLAGEARALALYFTARCFERQGRPGDVVSVLEGFTSDLSAPAAARYLPSVHVLRGWALIELGRLGEAEREWSGFREVAGDAGPAVGLARKLGRVLGKPPATVDELHRAAEYLSFAARGTEPARAADHLEAGRAYLELSSFTAAAEHFQVVRDLSRGKKEGLFEHATEHLARCFRELGRPADAAELLLELTLRRPADREEVLRILESQELTTDELQWVQGALKIVPGRIEVLARCEREVRTEASLTRARWLLRLLSLPGDRRYTPDWWRWQVLSMRVELDYEEVTGLREVLEGLLIRIRQWEGLGVLERSGVAGEVAELEVEVRKRLR